MDLGVCAGQEILGKPRQPRGGIPSAPGPWGEREGYPGHRQSGVPGAQPAALPEKEICFEALALASWPARKEPGWQLSPGAGLFEGEAHCATEVHLAVAAEQVGFLPRKGSTRRPGQGGRKEGLTDGRIRPGWRPARGWAALGARKAAREIMDKQVTQGALSVPLPEEPGSGSEIAQLPWLTENVKRLLPQRGWEPLAFLIQQ